MLKKSSSLLWSLLILSALVFPSKAMGWYGNDWCNPCGYWYASMGAGASFRDEEILGNGDKTFLAGPIMDVALGYRFNPHYRMEVAFAFRDHPLNRITDTTPGNPLTAEESSFNFMLNAIISTDSICRFTPYAGWGIGYGDVWYSIHTNELPSPSMTHTRHHSVNFAYQFIAGLAYQLNCHLDLALEYRFLGITDLKYRFLDSRFQTNDVVLKLVYAFRNGEEILRYCCPVFTNPAGRFYLTTKMGANFRETMDFFNGDKAFHVGPNFAAAVGYYLFCDWVRTEFEFGYRTNEVKKTTVDGFRATGDEIMLTVMVNGYLSPFSFCCFTPYVGAGLGYAYDSYAVHINLPPNTVGVPPTFPTFKHPRQHSNNFAYQIMGGVSYPISNRVLLSTEYQYFKIDNLEYQAFSNTGHEKSAANAVTIRLAYIL